MLHEIGGENGFVSMNRHFSWQELCRSSFKGLWVALDNCRYDSRTKKPVAGTVVDADAELTTLASRIREDGRCSCTILYCAEEPSSSPFHARPA
jgi:hypothetical protein